MYSEEFGNSSNPDIFLPGKSALRDIETVATTFFFTFLVNLILPSPRPVVGAVWLVIYMVLSLAAVAVLH
jgi:hypothetical protein